jgi:hypothetical protein
MAMKKMRTAASPAAYVAALHGWQAACVRRLRTAVRSAARFDERIKWGNLVYFSNGPAIVIRAEKSRVLFGFWRGKRLLSIEPRLKPGGKYEMATLELREGARFTAAVARKLAREAASLNRRIGDPTAAAKPARRQ